MTKISSLKIASQSNTKTSIKGKYAHSIKHLYVQFGTQNTKMRLIIVHNFGYFQSYASVYMAIADIFG